MSGKSESLGIPEGSYVTIAGADGGEPRRVHYHEAGPPDGHPVIFLHGSGPGASGYSNFKTNFGRLGARGFRALVPDSLGYGLSDKPMDTQYTLQYLADATRAFADALGLTRFSLIGNSLGGAMAIRVALDAPERVTHLVLMAPGGLEEREVYMGMRGIRRMLKCIFGPDGITAAGMRKVFELQLFDAGGLTDETLAERLAIADLQHRGVFETSRVPNQEDRLGELTCPVLAFWGRDDQFCPPTGAAKIIERCPDARVVQLTRCGHWVMVERAALFNRMTADFLTAVAM